MILYDAVNSKVGSTDVSEIRLGSDLVWTGEDTVILKATFAGKSTAHWDDGNTDELTSDTSITHTY